MRRPRETKRNWLSLAAVAAICVAVISLVWLWEYSKFADKHGIFYYLSPEYGAAILTATSAVSLVVLLSAVWIDLSD